MPPDVKKGETVNINVVVRASAPTKGTLQIYEKRDNYRSTAGGERPVPVELKRGINVFTLKQTITQPDFYTFTAEFVPEAGSGDRRAINNIAEGFTQARGEARVLLIEGTRGEHDELVQALRDKGLEVSVLFAGDVQGAGVVGGDTLPTDLAQLQPFDAVILGNVPKDVFSETQLQLLETNVHDMGAGLVMLGGDKSFGAGGWLNSPVERALPVDMQIKSMKVQVKSATVMIMHATEIAEGNYWMKVIAQESLKTLSPYDYAGMLHWNGRESWAFTVQPIGSNRAGMLRAIDRMTPNDMPDFGPSIQMAMKGLLGAKDAGARHIIIISDGDPAPPTAAIVNQLVQSKITVTTVLTAAHGNDPGSLNAMKSLALRTKGRFYNVTNPKALPRIYQKEARLVSQPLIFERPQPWLPVFDYPSEPVTGLPPELPPLTGLVLTSKKENELVEVPLKSPLPAGQENPLLAHWTYGLGRAVAFTSDAGRKWTAQWPSWDSYAAFWSQVVRWSLRPVDRGNLTLALRREEGRIKVVVDALDKQDQFLNFLQIRGLVVKPDLGRESVELAQVAPGRYEGTIEGAEARGNYFVSLGYVGPDGTQGLIQTGVSVPYSDEYRELQSDPETLATLAAVTDGQVHAWKTRRDGIVDVARTAAGADVFRRDRFTVPPRSFQALWPDLLWLAVVLFLGDVAVRRIAPDLDRMRTALANQWL
ncbi:MAG TPA: glutamine amidotransferase, partial [Isosphaeraceae bacterium]